jgi:hypothetical protein
MDARLRQLREGIAMLIAEDPSIIGISRKPMKDNGMGGQVEDPYGTPTTFKARVLLSHESSSVPENKETPVGLGTNLSMYVLTDHTAPLLEGDTFAALGSSWTVGPLNTLRYLGYVYATEAALTKRAS